jgi:hypothetical protein
MKLAYILAIMIATSASSALAAPAREAPSQPLLQAKPHDAYGRQRRHTDPDPNVQFEMMRQRNWRKG